MATPSNNPFSTSVSFSRHSRPRAEVRFQGHQPATYITLREHHKRAYDFLSTALEIDEEGSGECALNYVNDNIIKTNFVQCLLVGR